jgi:hypothetical protein
MAGSVPPIDFIFCPHCVTKNPRSAFVCLKCFKVLHSENGSWLKIRIPTSISITVIFAALVLAALYGGSRWLSTVEGNLTLHVKTSDYNVNLSADKRKNEALEKELDIKQNVEEPVAAPHEE